VNSEELSQETILSQADESRKVQRLSARSRAKRPEAPSPLYKGDDIVSSASRDAAVLTDGSRLATLIEGNDSTQVYYCATFGSSRMEEEKVVSIDCDESA
jgi:hypothetical protein